MGSKKLEIHALNLSSEMLECRVLLPYRQGNSITLKGSTIRCSEIARIQIFETADEQSLLEEADYFLLQLEGFTYSRSERDVTDDLITGPPGWEFDTAPVSKRQPRPMEGTRDVFVVHGRNLNARDALFDFLRAIDLHPLEWSQAVAATGRASPYIGEILEAAFSRAHAVVVLLTPDDEARLRETFRSKSDPPHETQLTGQARANVLFEAGMAMGRNADRTVLVELGSLRPFSDVAGLHVIRLDDTTQRRQELAQRLSTAGCPVNLGGTDWHTAGDFESAISPLSEETINNEAEQTRETSINEESQLSGDAKDLLIEASKGPETESKHIVMVRSFGGTTIQANEKDFAETGNARSEARWEQAIRDLEEHDLVDDRTGKDEVFFVTHKGFQLADELRQWGYEAP